MYYLLVFFLFLANGIHSSFSARSVPTEFVSDAEARTLSLEDLAARYDVFFLDAYGVFWGSREVGVLPGAAAAMEYLVSHGKYVAIISNSTQLASKEKIKFEKFGLHEGVHYHCIVTSGQVAKELLSQESLPFLTPRFSYWLFGTPHPNFGSHLQLFEGTKYRETKNLQDADFIYISIPHIDGVDQENPEVFRQMVEAVGNKIPVLCVNPDRFANEGSPPRPVVRHGSIAQMFAEQNTPVFFLGKPSKIIYEIAMRQLPSDVSKERIVMIGDSPETDLRGAHEIGIDSVLVTETGITAPFLEKAGIAYIHQLPASDQPKFLLERFGLKQTPLQ